MIAKLSIKNYAIISQLSVDFHKGFTVITGETGAGKSIILGALSLILGQRADTGVLKNSEKKCIIEGTFDLSDRIDLKALFNVHDLDFEETTYIRREITVQGKSRAFINDTPVNLKELREISLNLIDLHSQHANLELAKKQFQLNVIDWYGSFEKDIEKYRIDFNAWKADIKQYNELEEAAKQSKADLDYFDFQFKQLEEAALKEEEQKELEEEQEQLDHTEDIINGLSTIHQLLDGDEASVVGLLKNALSSAEKIKPYLKDTEGYAERMNSSLLDLRDMADESERLLETTVFDPQRLEWIKERLDTIYTLQQKHQVGSVAELLDIQNNLSDKIEQINSNDDELSALKKEIDRKEQVIKTKAEALSKKRNKLIPKVEKEVLAYLTELGMPGASFKVKSAKLEQFTMSGCDEVNFLFSAHKGGEPMDVVKVASGGELSRLMLSIKAIISKSKALPTIIFDEIDTGISGEIAGKMATILQEMSKFIQVINITHLPQIAAKGNNHYQVYKSENKGKTETGMKQLSLDERQSEVAKMLSGAEVTPEAMKNALSLING